MAELLYPSGYPTAGTGQPMRTIDKIKSRPDWLALAPEMQHRLERLILAGGGKIGFGSGGRTHEQQDALFRERHHVVPCPGHFQYDGECWDLDDGEASAAVPGNSFHESIPAVGGALAADMVGDLTLMHQLQESFGLHSFESVNDEPWHVQPVELPNSRSDYKPPRFVVGPLPAWTDARRINTTQTPTRPPLVKTMRTIPQTESEMIISILECNDADATFIAETTSTGALCRVVWVDGQNPNALAALAAHRARNSTVVKKVDTSQFRLLWTNQIPVGDNRHQWSKTDFAGVG